MASWDEDQENAIIEYVRKHPCFYDTKSADYKNRDLRSAEWENLAGKFKVSVPIVKRKWKALNDAYSRCMKEKASARSGDGAAPKVKWVHFEKMQFLAPFRTARETQTTLAVEDAGDPEQVDLTEDSATEENDGSQSSDGTQKTQETHKRMGPPSAAATPVAKKKKTSKVPDSPLDEAFKATLASITEQMNKGPSETQLFTDHIGTQLDKLSARRQLKAKDPIQRAVSQALDEQLAEEEAARAPPTSSHAWNSQVLPPTQMSQYPDYSYYPSHPSLLASSRPHSTSSALSSAGYASSPSGSSSDSNVMYNGLSNVAQLDG